jgi:hypothetical protein
VVLAAVRIALVAKLQAHVEAILVRARILPRLHRGLRFERHAARAS